MPIGIQSIDGYLKGIMRGPYPDIGQTYYVVDSDFRTQAQGWTRPDRTGPLDLLEARRPGAGGIQYVYRTGDYTTDRACLQDANDNMVDFRGDAMFFCPGNLSIATTAVTVDVPGARWLGRPVAHPAQAYTTITDAVGSGMALSAVADDMEIAFLRFVPLTATVNVNVTGAANGGYVHHCFWDSLGIAASTATGFMNFAGAAQNWWIDNMYWLTDGAQGPLIAVNGAVNFMEISNFRHYHSAGTLVSSLLDILAAGASGFRIRNGTGTIAGTTAAVTNLMTVFTTMTNVISNGSINSFWGDVGYSSVGALIGGGGSTGSFTMSPDCYLAVIQSTANTTALGLPVPRYIS